MAQTHPLKLGGRSSLRRNLKRVFKDTGSSGSVALFMVLCVIAPTVIIQGSFTIFAAWEILLTALLFLSLRMTSEE